MKRELTSLFDIEPSWKMALEDELQKPYIQELAHYLDQELASGTPIYPPKELIFNAFNKTPYDRVKVVIVGQDPYHGPGQAHGLCFSVPKEVKPPPSLKNIFKELVEDIGIPAPQHGCLQSWAEQGVLLLNATLTVSQGTSLSHHGKGWERFTDAVIANLCERKDPLIFVLWGKFAQEKCHHIQEFEETSRHYVLTAPHPSPFSARRGFFGCQHFSQINHILEQLHREPINWEVT